MSDGIDSNGITTVLPKAGHSINGHNVFLSQIQEVEVLYDILSTGGFAPPVPSGNIDINQYHKEMLSALEKTRKHYSLFELIDNSSIAQTDGELDSTYLVVGEWIPTAENGGALYYASALTHKQPLRKIILMCLSLIRNKLGFMACTDTMYHGSFCDLDEGSEYTDGMIDEDQEAFKKCLEFHQNLKMTFPHPVRWMLEEYTEDRTHLAHWIRNILYLVDSGFNAVKFTPYQLIDFDNGIEPVRLCESHVIHWDYDFAYRYYIDDLNVFWGESGLIDCANHSVYTQGKKTHTATEGMDVNKVAAAINLIFDFDLKTLKYYGNFNLKSGALRSRK